MKSMLLITAGFPYSDREKPFLLQEFNELKQHFSITILALKSNIQKAGKDYDSFDIRTYEETVNSHLFLKTICSIDLIAEIGRISLFHFKSQNERIDCIKYTLGYANKAQNLIPKIRKIVEEKNIDIIYTYWCTPATLASIWLKERFPNLKVVSRFHGYDLYNERVPCGRQAFRDKIGTCLDILFFCSKAGKNYFKDKWRISGTLAYIGTNEQERVIPDLNHLVLVSCANIVKLKRIELIIKALAQVNEECRIEWHHFGDGEERNNIENLAEQLIKNKKNIIYCFHGFVNNEEMMHAYKSLKPSLFITTSSTEGSPISIQEAFAMGIPCIGTNVGGIPELVKDKTNGYLLSDNPDVLDISKAIESYYFLDSKSKKRFQNAAYKTWLSKYNGVENAKKFCTKIDNLLID